jgi:MFS family permease
MNFPTSESYKYFISSTYIAYSAPNVILPFFGGALIDRYGTRSIALIFSTLCVLGQLVFVIGVVSGSPSWALFGRVLFGLGGETLSVSVRHIKIFIAIKWHDELRIVTPSMGIRNYVAAKDYN